MATGIIIKSRNPNGEADGKKSKCEGRPERGDGLRRCDPATTGRPLSRAARLDWLNEHIGDEIEAPADAAAYFRELEEEEADE
jgi:hypothetical protein